MKVLITGVTGFVGPYLVKEILEHLPDCELWGTYQPGTLPTPPHSILSRVRLVEYDLVSGKGSEKLIDIDPQLVIHLAAQSSVASSWQKKEATLESNVTGTLRLLEAMLGMNALSRTLLIGSAEEYGLVKAEESPINESNPVRPLSPYGVSKLAAGLLGLQFFRAYGLPVIVVRAFNHIGPGQRTGFVTSDFAKQIAEIEKGSREPVLRVGNLEALRDFTDVRDVVRAYRLLALGGAPGEIYNIASGRGVSIARVLEILLSMAKVNIQVQVDADRLRLSEVPVMVGSHDKLKRAVGWQPKITLEKSLRDILDYWRAISIE